MTEFGITLESKLYVRPKITSLGVVCDVWESVVGVEYKNQFY